MTTEELHDEIMNCSTDLNRQTINKMLNILERMNGNIRALERRLGDNERTARRAANVASCLANGIQPD